jgi:outer membrane protein TolC
MKRITYMFLILTGAMFLSAESPLVLNEKMAVDLALAQNPNLQSGRLDLESIQDLSIRGGVSRSEEVFTENSYLDGDSWSVNATLNASLTLNSAGILGIKTNKLSYDSQSLYYKTAEDQLKINVRKQFYYLLAYKENLEMVKKNLELAE